MVKTVPPIPYRCACPDFAKAKHRRYATTGNMTGKSSQPVLVSGNIVSARCSHHAYFLAVKDFLEQKLHPKSIETKKI
jgi:hypothetical protein